MSYDSLSRFKNKFHSRRKQFICYFCPVLKSYKNKYSLLRHQNNKHKGSRNKIEAKKSYIKLSENEVSNLEYRSIKCLYCEANFSCIQDQETHLVDKHKWEKGFKCNLCSKLFRIRRYLQIPPVTFNNWALSSFPVLDRSNI